MNSAHLIALLLVISCKASQGTGECVDKTQYASDCGTWTKYCTDAEWKQFMQDNCPATCGHCVKTCADTEQHKTSCASWKEGGYCVQSSEHYAFMKDHCSKTCGFCSIVICKEDSAHYATNCPTWKDSGYCTNSHQQFMKDHCFKTCRFECIVPCKEDSLQYASDCPTWKSSGFCHDDTHGQFMKDHCFKTCGYQCKEILKCGVGKKTQGVVSGVNAVRNSWPWQVGFYFYDSFFCGGSLISDRYIITAAHCMAGRSSDGMTVKLGDHVRDANDGTEQTIEVESFTNHPDYNTATIENDIAIVKLKSAAKLNTNVGLICLPGKDEEVDLQSTCYITGWGKTSGSGSAANVLQEARLPLVSNAKCSEKNVNKQGQSMITNVMLCAGFNDGRLVSGCHGDSGGPFVCRASDNRWVLQGAVSWGSPTCDATDRYTVFARVSKYIDWINANMK